MAPLDVSFCLLTEDQGLPSWTHLILIGLCFVLGLCHSFKSCALPSSLLFQVGGTFPRWESLEQAYVLDRRVRKWRAGLSGGGREKKELWDGRGTCTVSLPPFPILKPQALWPHSLLPWQPFKLLHWPPPPCPFPSPGALLPAPLFTSGPDPKPIVDSPGTELLYSGALLKL